MPDNSNNLEQFARLQGEALEQLLAQVQQLKEERDFWENEYEEVIACLDGQDPRR